MEWLGRCGNEASAAVIIAGSSQVIFPSAARGGDAKRGSHAAASSIYDRDSGLYRDGFGYLDVDRREPVTPG